MLVSSTTTSVVGTIFSFPGEEMGFRETTRQIAGLESGLSDSGAQVLGLQALLTISHLKLRLSYSTSTYIDCISNYHDLGNGIGWPAAL